MMKIRNLFNDQSSKKYSKKTEMGRALVAAPEYNDTVYSLDFFYTLRSI